MAAGEPAWWQVGQVFNVSNSPSFSFGFSGWQNIQPMTACDFHSAMNWYTEDCIHCTSARVAKALLDDDTTYVTMGLAWDLTVTNPRHHAQVLSITS